MAAISSIVDCRALALSKGGACLSETYSGYRGKLRWRCEKGHEWEAAVGNMTKSWCSKCGKAKSGASRLGDNLAEAGRIAEGHGGRCLATEPAPANTPIPWRCAEGHEWSAALSNVRRGSWCPSCFKSGGRKLRNDNLGEAQELARAHGGRCLAAENFRAKEKVRWGCSEGHQWSTQMCVIRRGSWCPTCAAMAQSANKTLDNLTRARRVAAQKGWKCLETENFQANDSIHWECEKGHQWQSRLHNYFGDREHKCAQCSFNLTEGFCCDVLRAIFPGYSFAKRKSLPWMATSDRGRSLELDLYCEELSLALEYNGFVHYESHEYLGGDEKLATIQEHDRRKVEACESEGISLIVIPEPEVRANGTNHPSKERVAARIYEEVQALGYTEVTINIGELLQAVCGPAPHNESRLVEYPGDGLGSKKD